GGWGGLPRDGAGRPAAVRGGCRLPRRPSRNADLPAGNAAERGKADAVVEVPTGGAAASAVMAGLAIVVAVCQPGMGLPRAAAAYMRHCTKPPACSGSGLLSTACRAGVASNLVCAAALC